MGQATADEAVRVLVDAGIDRLAAIKVLLGLLAAPDQQLRRAEFNRRVDVPRDEIESALEHLLELGMIDVRADRYALPAHAAIVPHLHAVALGYAREPARVADETFARILDDARTPTASAEPTDGSTP